MFSCICCVTFNELLTAFQKEENLYIHTHTDAYISINSGCYSRNNLYALTMENYFLLSTCVYGKGIWWDAKTWWRIFLLLLRNHFKMRLFMLIHFSLFLSRWYASVLINTWIYEERRTKCLQLLSIPNHKIACLCTYANLQLTLYAPHSTLWKEKKTCTCNS